MLQARFSVFWVICRSRAYGRDDRDVSPRAPRTCTVFWAAPEFRIGLDFGRGCGKIIYCGSYHFLPLVPLRWHRDAMSVVVVISPGT